MADTVLVPFDLPDPEPLPPTLVDALATPDIVVLGHYALPEGTTAEAARERFEDEAWTALDRATAPLKAAGASVVSRLVFGKDRGAAIDRVAIEEGCDAALDPAPTEGIDRILVPISRVAEFERLPTFVQLLCADSTAEITLLHVVEGDERRAEGERIVRETREGLIEAGFDAEHVTSRVVEDDDHDRVILRTAADCDAVVMYGTSERASDRLFGTLPGRIEREAGSPVVVVRREY